MISEEIDNKIFSNFRVSDNVGKECNTSKSIDELKLSLDNIRKKIGEEKINNDKFMNILNNLNKNKEITKKKIDGNIKIYAF